MSDIFMDTEKVMGVSKTLNVVGDVCEVVSTALQVTILGLKTIGALLSFGATAAIAQFLEMIKPIIDRIGRQCKELSADVQASVEAYLRGDEMGSTRFH